MTKLYHPFLPKSVERIVTLIESKGAIYRGLVTNIFLHISRNVQNEYDTNQELPVFLIAENISTSLILLLILEKELKFK